MFDWDDPLEAEEARDQAQGASSWDRLYQEELDKRRKEDEERQPRQLVEAVAHQEASQPRDDAQKPVAEAVAHQEEQGSSDLASLSIKELKERIRSAGLTIPASGAVEKADLVELLRSASVTTSPVAAATAPVAVPAAPAISTWRCVVKPRMVIREAMDTGASPLRGLKYGEEIEVDGEPVNGWLKVIGGGYALIKHPTLGLLLEKLDMEIDVTVFLDRDAGVSSEFRVARGSTVKSVKEMLASSDPTGETKPEDFHLALPSLSPGAPARVLADGTGISNEHRELDLVVRGETALADTASGGTGSAQRASVDWEEVRDESARKVRDARGKPYAVLDLPQGSPSAEIRRAYHRLSLLHHPDKGGDAEVFKAVRDAYKVLTQAKDEQGGWRDLEGQAVGPWIGHSKMVKGVNVIRFDPFTCPPWESRRLYTGAFQEGGVRCWELSKGEPGKVRPPPRLLGEIHSGGFLNDIALLSPFGMLTAQSAGMKPMPGESLRSWNLNITSFRRSKGAKKAIGDDAGAAAKSAAIADRANAEEDEEARSKELQLTKAAEGAVDAKSSYGSYEPPADAAEELLKSTMIYQHYRGVRSISLWPRPERSDTVPQLAATISKDWMAIWKISLHGLGIETPCIWSQGDPHMGKDPCVMKHESEGLIWTTGSDGSVKLWDVDQSGGKPLMHLEAVQNGSITGLEIWPAQGVIAFSHSGGLGYIDKRAGKLIRNQFTKNKVGGLSMVNEFSPSLFAGIGKDLIQYDTRLWQDGTDYKPKAVGSWTLRDVITAVHTTESSKGHVLVALGCEDGSIAAFDSA